ncbi:hypothetical protein ABZ915_15505 [Streptomyces sp. NPDC046915]|uniref:hypothetical protein n=1 Tax=Streptomyces sp. NPDC046915 TaxID=3155257 RepID=UPI0033D3FB6F
MSFASAAVHHGLADPNRYLEAVGGDADEAWEAWAKDSVEGPWYEGDDEDDDDDAVHGWLSAHIGGVAPGEYTIELYDDLGMPGNATYVGALRFSLPVTVAAESPSDRDARVIKAATEEIADYGYIPGSDFYGSGDSFSVQVRASDRALEWVEEQRPPAEKLELLLAGLQGLLDEPATVRTGRGRPRIETTPKPRPGLPDRALEADAGTSILDWDDREAFLEALAAQQPDRVVVERYQGGWAGRLDGAEDLEHPGLRGLEEAQAEAARREGELSGFSAVFRSGAEAHRYRIQADWAEELDRRLEVWEQDVRAVREEQARFPHLEQWGTRLCEALLDDEQFLAAQTTPAQDRRGADLARSMFGSDCPVNSVYIRRALAQARAGRADLLVERRRTRWRADVPAWAARLAASADFQRGTTAERAMLASNLLYAHHPEADTPELVRLLRTAAADLLA